MATSTAAVQMQKPNMSPEEWKARVDLAAAFRLSALEGWDEILFAHISARVPGTTNHFLMHPAALFFEEVTASNLHKLDENCNHVNPSLCRFEAVTSSKNSAAGCMRKWLVVCRARARRCGRTGVRAEGANSGNARFDARLPLLRAHVGLLHLDGGCRRCHGFLLLDRYLALLVSFRLLSDRYETYRPFLG